MDPAGGRWPGTGRPHVVSRGPCGELCGPLDEVRLRANGEAGERRREVPVHTPLQGEAVGAAIRG